MAAAEYEYEISLTAPQSHVLRVPRGVGNLYIGPQKQPKGTPQTIVGVDDVLDWSSLDTIEAGGAYRWPRAIYYEGNDAGIFRWAVTRRVERLIWTPSGAMTVDARSAQIDKLTMRLDASEIELELPDALDLCVEGNAEMLDPRHDAEGEGVSLSFVALGVGCELPLYPHLAQVRSLYARSEAVAIDCRALARYAQVRLLSMSGPLVGVDELVKMKPLEQITLRETWNLSNFPSLESWQNLQVFEAFHLPRVAGRRLRSEAKRLPHIESTIGRLHSPEWIAKNARSPFRRWAEKLRAPAQWAFDDATEQLARAVGAEAVREVVDAFLDALNSLDEEEGLMTTEREDTAGAVDLMVSNTGHRELREQAQTWFDARRAF